MPMISPKVIKCGWSESAVKEGGTFSTRTVVLSPVIVLH